MSELTLKQCVAMQEKYRGPRAAITWAMFAAPMPDFLTELTTGDLQVSNAALVSTGSNGGGQWRGLMVVSRYWLLICPVTFARRIRLAYQTLCTEHVKLLSLCFTGCSTPSGRCVTSDGRLHALVPCGSCLLRSSTETNTICLVSGVCFSGLRDSPDHDDYLCVPAQADQGRALPARKTRHIVQIGPFFL